MRCFLRGRKGPSWEISSVNWELEHFFKYFVKSFATTYLRNIWFKFVLGFNNSSSYIAKHYLIGSLWYKDVRLCMHSKFGWTHQHDLKKCLFPVMLLKKVFTQKITTLKFFPSSHQHKYRIKTLYETPILWKKNPKKLTSLPTLFFLLIQETNDFRPIIKTIQVFTRMEVQYE